MASPPRASIRAIAAITACVLVALAAVAAAGVGSSLYASVALDAARYSGGRDSGVEAAQIAARLTPWRTQVQQAYAQSLSATGALVPAIEHGRAAVRANPADAYTWAYLARLSGSAMRADPHLAGYYAMAVARAPNAAPLQWAIALDGARRWRSGDVALRQLWRDSMAFSLRHNRRAFLRQIVHLGRDPYWCATLRDDLPIAQWCDQVATARQICAHPELPAKAVARCRRIGILPAGQ